MRERQRAERHKLAIELAEARLDHQSQRNSAVGLTISHLRTAGNAA